MGQASDLPASGTLGIARCLTLIMTYDELSSNLRWRLALICAGLVALEVAPASTQAAPTKNNPYSSICERNVFQLKPPAPRPPDPIRKPPDLLKVWLTGFIGIDDRVRVLLAIPSRDGKSSMYYTKPMLPGDKEHGVELVNIHFAKEEVEIVNEGFYQTLSVKSNRLEELPKAVPSGPYRSGVGLSPLPKLQPPPSLSPAAQAAVLLIQEAAGGPPSPIQMPSDDASDSAVGPNR